MASSTESEKRLQRIKEQDNKMREDLVRVGSAGTSQQLTELYNDMAVFYDEISPLVKYEELGVASLVAALSELVTDKEARILDVGAGSGMAGKKLQTAGYTNVDALEPAEKMLEIAKSANVYRNYYIDIITSEKKCSIEDDAFDAVIIMGSVVHGHITMEHLPELMRITKKGGVIAFNVSDKYLQTDYPFKTGEHTRLFQRYVDNGEWLKWDEKKAPYRKSENCSIFRITLA